MKYNIVLFGIKSTTNEIISTFKNDIDLVVTLSDKSVEKYHISGLDNVYDKALEHDIECHRTNDYSLKTDIDFFENNSFDIGLVYGWQRIIPQNILDKFKFGVYGFHGSPKFLPFGKGRSPMNWSLIKNYKEINNHLFKYNSKADDGEIYSITKFEINEYDTIDSLIIKSMITSKREFSKLIKDYRNNNITLREQPVDVEETFFDKRTPEDGKINLFDSTQDIYNLIRGVTKPFPGAFLFKNNSKVILWEAVPFDSILDFDGHKVGEIIKVMDNKFIMNLKDNTLLVKNYECTGKLKEGDILK